MRWLGLGAVLMAVPASGAAQPVVVSTAPDAVSVSAYRSPYRDPGEEMELDWLEGYALITETRTLPLPAGRSEVRLEGVAGTIIPTSVIVRGLPNMPGEQNYDARLLSPGTLAAGYLGQQVHIRRTDGRTGEVSEGEAIIRADNQGIILQTADGIEALRCSDMAETLLYDDVPAGLTDKPTLSIKAVSPDARQVEIQLSYLAAQFDWEANYVVTPAKDGKVDVFAWLTMANGTSETFNNARIAAIAGSPEYEEESVIDPVVAPISIRCWPRPDYASPAPTYGPPPPPPPPPPPAAEYYDDDDLIVITGSRVARPNLESASPVTVITAEQEALGDLKLYRVPELMDVAANGQKQIALLKEGDVEFERVYLFETWGRSYYDEDEWEQLEVLLRTDNRKDKGLGVPLPAGSLTLYEEVDGQLLVAGIAPMENWAVGEKVKLRFGESPDVTANQRAVSATENKDGDRKRKVWYEIALRNARPVPVPFEVEIALSDGEKLQRPSERLIGRGRGHIWSGTIEPGEERVLRYRIKTPKDRN